MRKISAYPAVIAYGLRPFFLLAGIYTATTLPVRVVSLYGYELSGLIGPTQLWHAHEMIYGFIAAALAGFLLTAIPSWAGRRGFAGVPLILMTLLWLAGRVVFIFYKASHQ